MPSTVLRVVLALAVPTVAAAVNYVPNPGFEACGGGPPTAWAPFGTDSVSCDGSMPNTGAFSLALTPPAGATIARAQSDCVVVPPSTSIQTFRFAYRTASAAVVQVALTAQTYTGDDCTGSSAIASAGAGFSFVQPIATDGDWHTLPTVTALVDAGMHSVRLVASFQTDAMVAATVHFDDLEFATASSTTTTPGSTTTSTTGATTSTTAVTVTTTTSATPTTQPTSFPGTGPAASECYVTFEGIASGRIDCTDGDAACDRDGAADGACTFTLRVCVAQPLAGCQPGTVTAVKAIPATAGIPLPSVPATTPACAAPAPVTVPLRKGGRRAGRRTLAFVAKRDGKPRRERDVLRFRCLPPA